MKSTLYIMCGLPFSGKTTLSKIISNFLNIPRISFDETWLEIEKDKGIIPGGNSVEQWKYICKECEEKARQYLLQNISVVYDNLGTTIQQREDMRDLAKDAGAEPKVVY